MTVNTNTVPGANGDKLYGYLTADPYTTKYENENVVAYPIWTGSENTTVYEKGSAIKDGGRRDPVSPGRQLCRC